MGVVCFIFTLVGFGLCVGGVMVVLLFLLFCSGGGLFICFDVLLFGCGVLIWGWLVADC